MSATEAAIAELSDLLGEQVSTGTSVREHHGKDESWHAAPPPDAVVFAKSTDDVAKAVSICASHKIPVIPFGTGTGLEGGVMATNGGISIDLTGMNAITRVSPEDMDCTVQAGVTRKQLNVHLRDTGLFFPIDPGADASVGGMAATRASGTNAVRYGTMRENVLSLKAVMPNGEIIETGSRARKSAAGYDLTHLMVGSEGTLGIITEVTLRLHAIPETMNSAVVTFDSIDSAVNAVITTMQCAIPIARIEFSDEANITAMNAFSGTDFPVAPLLMVEFHGSPAGVEEQIAQFKEICDDFGSGHFRWTKTAEEHSAMWQARHDAAYAAMALRPGASAVATDVCVPISALADCIGETKKDLEQNACFPTGIVGHVGDGNFHCVFLVDRESEKEMTAMNDLNNRLVNRALEMGGTSTGEHGIGLGKQKYLTREFGESAVAAMAAVKQALDPDNIMNPGKKIPLN